MKTIKEKVNSLKALHKIVDTLAEMFMEFKYLNVTISLQRSLDQNALIYAAYQIVADHREMDSIDVRRECKLNYGTHILREDPAIDWVYKNSIDKLRDYEKKIKIIDAFQVTSIMSPEQIGRYYDAICNDYPFVIDEIQKLKDSRNSKGR